MPTDDTDNDTQSESDASSSPSFDKKLDCFEKKYSYKSHHLQKSIIYISFIYHLYIIYIYIYT